LNERRVTINLYKPCTKKIIIRSNKNMNKGKLLSQTVLKLRIDNNSGINYLFKLDSHDLV